MCPNARASNIWRGSWQLRGMALSSEEISLSCSQNCQDNQIELIIKAFNYLTKKEYPLLADKNERRIIRRKAAKLTVDKGNTVEWPASKFSCRPEVLPVNYSLAHFLDNILSFFIPIISQSFWQRCLRNDMKLFFTSYRL